MRGISLKLALLVTMPLAMATLSGLTQAQPGFSRGGDSSSCDSRGFWSRFVAADPSCASGNGEDGASDKDDQSRKGRLAYASYGDNSEKSDKSGRSGGWERDGSEKDDQSEKDDGNGRSDKSGKNDQSTRSDKSDKSDKSEKSSKDEDDGDSGDDSSGDDTTTPAAGSCTAFYAGQSTQVGKVCVTADNSSLTVTYHPDEGYGLRETHTWVGDDQVNMPQTGGGNPRPGRFPYGEENLGGSTSWSVTIPFSDLVVNADDDVCGSELTIATHAALTNGESAWAGTERFVERGNWATYFSMLIDCSGDDAGPPTACQQYVVPAAFPSGELMNASGGWALGDNDTNSLALFDGSDTRIERSLGSGYGVTLQFSDQEATIDYDLTGSDYFLYDIRVSVETGGTEQSPLFQDTRDLSGSGTLPQTDTWTLDGTYQEGNRVFTEATVCTNKSVPSA